MRHLPVCIVLLAYCATPSASHIANQPPEPRACVLPRLVDSFAAQGIDVVNIKAKSDYYRLALAEACPEIQESDRIQLIPRGGGTSFVCVNEAANATVVAYSKVTGPKRCMVKTMQHLTAVEVAALPAKEKP